METEEKDKDVEYASTAECMWSLILSAPLTLLEGHVISDLWGWFIVPLGAPEIATMHMTGILALIALAVTVNRRPAPRPKSGELGMWATTLALLSLIMWGAGALMNLLMQT